MNATPRRLVGSTPISEKTPPEVTEPTHLSAEAGHRAALERLDLKPMLDLGMRLGEGTGAALGLQLMEAAVRLHNEMATFQQASVAGPADEAGQGGESA